ncbi:MAG: transcription-repair coupling factor, partial [Deltaproteobacteria bacterium]|nr:transcription-repair coupling factor [Deltaproteobacteria bacterium]
EPKAIQRAAEDYHAQALATYKTACDESNLCVHPKELALSWQSAKKRLDGARSLQIHTLAVMSAGDRSDQTPRHHTHPTADVTIRDNDEISLKLKASRETENLLRPLIDWIEAQQTTGHDTLLTCQSRSQSERLLSLLAPYGVDPETSDGFPNHRRAGGRVVVCTGQVSNGFVWPDAQLSVITEQEIFGQFYRKRKKIPKQVRTELLALEDMKKQDLVVHMEHGIGQYLGLVKLKLNTSTNDFLIISYKGADKLYLPVDRMSMIEKYRGVDDVVPVLDKLGGKSWEKIKERVKKTTEKIAGELLKLYAARKVEKGFTHHLPTRSIQEFEAAFPYEETTDQAKAIDDVLADMSGDEPMDRLVCGDVGYGKTEVALRASFVAVNNGKQVAVLVPTTVLAEQHHATFTQRYGHHPVIVECLSRFRSAAEQRRIIEALKAGKIDIIIGTHRLLSRDVGFKDLGLLVLDEEQRFGVKHKERLKKLRQTVDVLTMTATPIPRTLHLSLVGIRDISVISTPPEQRHAIVTYIAEFDESTIAEAIRKELKRKGQIFFVHNHISTIHAMAARVQRLVPNVRLAVAHGRMNEDDLESVMRAFANREIDMLVCTTIIESGLDISTANTIIINRADRFGLAQIYQLRGRVGRSDEQAYAYLFIPPDSVMTKDAQKRLKVLMEHSDLGSGFQIAMSDLKIRGGGTILGASQSGHIAAVGYDMFLKLMETSIADLKGEPKIEDLDPEINIPLSAFLPETYIEDIDHRLAAYRRLAQMNEPGELSEFKSELTDRFGKLPDDAANLLMKILLRVLAIRAGVKRMDMGGSRLLLHFSTEHQRNPLGIVELTATSPDRFKFTSEQVLQVALKAGPIAMRVAQAKNILKEISQHVNA